MVQHPGPTPSASQGTAAAIYLDPQQSPYFSGVAGTLTLSASGTLPLAGTREVEVAEATIDFGDGGLPIQVSGTCSSAPGPLSIEHAYSLSGKYTARILSARLCTATSSLDLTDVADLLVLPTATTAEAKWPTCSTFQLHMTGAIEGVGLGHAAVLLQMENVSPHGCTLLGYPGLQLVGPTGRLLPTDVREAIDGDYMFPAIEPHLTALAPGGYAAIMVGMNDNASEPLVDAPYDVACPLARAVRVILPGTHEFGTVALPMNPCNGWLDVSAVYPGQGRISFQ